jgi:hypothetical protein
MNPSKFEFLSMDMLLPIPLIICYIRYWLIN